MKAPLFHHNVRTTDITVLVQAGILGFLLGEIWFLSKVIGSVLNPYIQAFDKPFFILIFCGITVIIGIAYIFIRGGYSDIGKLIKCNRIDLVALVVLFVLGLSVSIITGGVGTLKYKEYVDKIPVQQLVLLTITPVVMALMLLLRVMLTWPNKNEPAPFFINDQAIRNSKDDLLGLSEYAFRFAERVLNGGSSDSLVFGIDAPWGIGKSSFVNFCREYWRDEAHPRPIVYCFEPLRYRDGTDLVDKFVNGMVGSIQRNVYVPSLESLFANYLRLIKGKKELSFFGIKFELEPGSTTVDETLEALEIRLSELNRKIIIVVDDLDRLSWTEVKNILFAIKRSFILPNVSYVLCYDTENLASLAKTFDDAEKVKEFLEKFVNVKIGLFLDSNILAEFVDSNISNAINKNLNLDVRLLDQIRQALKALVDIYKSEEYVFYQDFLGDIRKIKRLINTMMLFGIPDIDFENSDFNKHDLIHLLLVYINYPNVFRRIYNSETGGKGGFFSLEYNGSEGKGFANSSNYIKYIEGDQLTENQKFLLNKIFHVDVLKTMKSGDEMADRMSRACFNGEGGSGRNLEKYLYLIVKLAKQEKREGYQFYVKKKNELLQGVSLDKIFDNDDFNFSEGDFSRGQLWSVIANSAHEMTPDIGSAVVVYLMENLPDYSFFEREKIGAGSRVNLVYSLLRFLDEAAWGVGLTGRRNNSEKNISEIAEWVFGEGGHVNNGVVSTLSDPKRGPLGLFDLLLFRLYCSADRGSNLFNLQRAISLHGNPNAPTQGLTTEIAKEGMREISQIVFQIFLKQYIKPKKNIFEAIDNLTLDNFAGKSAGFVRNQVKSGEISEDELDAFIDREKSHVKAFVTYQLGNSIISSGVGCGYYDVAGKEDGKGIAAKVNEYLFRVCFNPRISSENYERFLDYLLINFANTFGNGDGFAYVPNVSEFTKVLEVERLKKYWALNSKKIKALELEKKKKRVVTGSYIATYKDDLHNVYRVLDDLVMSKPKAEGTDQLR